MLDAMKKNGRTESLIGALAPIGSEAASQGIDRSYLAYFQLFNAQRYFEAHDVLEHLWLSCRGGTGEKKPDSDYFKGLIQVAGAYVHLQKHFFGPNHPKDSRRLHPACRLFGLAMQNLAPYGPVHIALDVEGLRRSCQAQMDAIIGSGYTVNPWRPEKAPSLLLFSSNALA